MKIRLIAFAIILLSSHLLSASSDIENTMAFSLYKEKKYEDAIAICKEVLKKEPNNLEALYIMGISNFMLKNYQEAESAFSRFLYINPYNYEVVRYNAICKFYNGKYKDSISEFEKIPKYQEDPLVLLFLALNYNRLMDKENLTLIIKKIETTDLIKHKNKEEFIQIIKKAMGSDLEATKSMLENFRDKYDNQFIISSKLISIDKNTKKDTGERLRLMFAINEAFDTNVVLYPDKDATKLPEVKYGERYDTRTEVRYSLGYKILDTPSNIFGILYNGYQGINYHLSEYNFNANELIINYRHSMRSFHLGASYHYNYDFISNDFKAYDFGHRLDLELGYNSGERLKFAIGSPILLRHYFERVYSADFSRSGFLFDPFLYLSYKLGKDFIIFNKKSFGISLSEGDAFKYMRPRARLGIDYKLGRALGLFTAIDYSYYIFSENISNPDYIKDISSGARTDSRITVEAGMDIRLFSDKFYLNCGYAFLMNMSNVKSGFYDYSRHTVSSGLKFVY